MLVNKIYKKLRLILGDQLNSKHHWYQLTDDSTLYVIAELQQEATYTKHHIQKLCAFFSAMQQFAETLQQAGHQVLHLNLNDTAEYLSLPALIQQLCKRYSIRSFDYQRPDEFRSLEQLRSMILYDNDESLITVCEHDTDHFLVEFKNLTQYFDRTSIIRWNFSIGKCVNALMCLWKTANLWADSGIMMVKIEKNLSLKI